MVADPLQLAFDEATGPLDLARERAQRGEYDPDGRTVRDRVARLLADGRWHSSEELVRVGGHRFGAAVFELRCEGLEIECERTGRRSSRYRWPAPPGAPVREPGEEG